MNREHTTAHLPVPSLGDSTDGYEQNIGVGFEMHVVHETVFSLLSLKQFKVVCRRAREFQSASLLSGSRLPTEPLANIK